MLKIKKDTFCLTIILIVLLWAGPPKAWAEKLDSDMYASVVVNPIFALSLDNANIRFGEAEAGKTVELKPDTYYNLVNCNSNKGAPWYLKISILGDIVGPTPSIGLDSFKWKVFGSTGDGVYESDWQPFTKEAQVAYRSGSMDNTGQDVEVQFKYKLDLPGDAAAGNYSVKVIYTMTETP